MKPIIEVEGIGKKYCRSLKRSMRYGMADVTRDLIGLPVNSSNLRPEEFWAFEDVSFSVRPGECLGLIGANGAGKSTLLKLLAGIFPPDHGHIRVHGRVSSLIEVGAGFHPLLSGRENVYINGSILGMSSHDIDAHMDEIIEFAGVGDFIDSPVKHYSSGMYVRLGFSIAAHSNPDVLLVDEALAVGDMAFNIKCLNRIAEMRGQGVCVVFVSHNELQVREAADRCLLLSQGRVVYQGNVDTAFQHYELHDTDDDNYADAGIQSFGSSVDIRDFSMVSTGGSGTLQSGEDAWVKMAFHCSKDERNVYVELRIWDQDGTLLGTVDSRNLGQDLDLAKGDSELHLTIRNLPLVPGRYRIAGGMRRDGEVLGWAKEMSRVSVSVPDGIRIGAGKMIFRAERLEVTRCDL